MQLIRLTVKLRRTVLGGCLLLAAASSLALTVGRVRGAAWVGQPLDVSVPVRLDASEEPASLCAEADVFHADTRVDSNRLRISTDAGPAAQEATVRIRSAAIVDEPVVTVSLRVGCAQKVVRRYVLLADVPPGGAAPVASGLAAQQDLTGELSPADNPPSGPVARGPAVARKPSPPLRAQRGAQQPAAATRQASAPSAPRRSVITLERPAAAKPRLRLEPLDFLAERDPVLRATTELLTAPGPDEQKRAEAAALWRSLSAAPEDRLRDSQRLQKLESDLQELRAQSLKNQEILIELATQLRTANSERYANGLVYALAALLVAALAFAAHVWRAGRGGAHHGWPGGHRESPRSEEALGPAAPVAAAAPAAASGQLWKDGGVGVQRPRPTTRRTPSPSQSIHPPVARSGTPAAVVVPEFDSSFIGGERSVNAEELFDIQQQADFFVSLGQHDQAIEVLKNHIGDSVETSPLTYLDLLNMYRALDRRDDYNQLRDDFHREFNVQVPRFEAFTETSRGLEANPATLSRIVSLWPAPAVLDVIEESIFRKSAGGEDGAFGLEAYRDLLLLFAIAKEVVDPGHEPLNWDAPEPASGPSDTEPQPLPDLDIPSASVRLGLDIDLADLGPFTMPPGLAANEGTKVDAAGSTPPAGGRGLAPNVDFVDTPASAQDKPRTHQR